MASVASAFVPAVAHPPLAAAPSGDALTMAARLHAAAEAPGPAAAPTLGSGNRGASLALLLATTATAVAHGRRQQRRCRTRDGGCFARGCPSFSSSAPVPIACRCLPDAEQEEAALWRQAFEAEKERGERLRNAATEEVVAAAAETAFTAPIAPGQGATAADWRAAYEALRDANAAAEAEEAERRRRRRAEEGGAEAQLDRPPAPTTKEAAVAAAVGMEAPTAAPASAPSAGTGLRPKVLSIVDLPTLSTSSERLAEVGRLRDVLGPGSIPLLAALFGEAASSERMPPRDQVRDALALPGTPFRVETSLDLGRCFVVRGKLASAGANSGDKSARHFLDGVQARLDKVFGQGCLVAILQRERYQPTPGLNSFFPEGQFADRGGRGESGDEARGAILLVFLSADLPIPEKPGALKRLAIGSSGILTIVFCNILAVAVGSLEDVGVPALGGLSVPQATYSPLFGAAVSRLDAEGVAPIGIALALLLLAQGAGREVSAAAAGAKLRGGYFLPSPILGNVGRTWGFDGLAPSRQAEVDVVLGGALAGITFGLLLVAFGISRGDETGGLLLVDVTRLPLLLVKAIGRSFPVDPSFTFLSLRSASQGTDPGVDDVIEKLVPLDPFLFAGALALTTQAVQLLPLRGFDGFTLMRYVLGPRPLQFVEIITAVLLLLGSAGRLGPASSPQICSSVLLAWGLSAVARVEYPMPPKEDFDDEPVQAGNPKPFIVVALLMAAGAILVPGHLVPYGILPRPDF